MILSRTKRNPWGLMRAHLTSSQFVGKLLVTFWPIFSSVQVKICSIFPRSCFSCLLLMGLCATILNPYLKSMWIISTLPTWPFTLAKWKRDYLIFIMCSRQIHVGCALVLYYLHGCFYVDFFPRDPSRYWTLGWFGHNSSGWYFPVLKDRVLFPLCYSGMSPVIHKFLNIISNYLKMAPARYKSTMGQISSGLSDLITSNLAKYSLTCSLFQPTSLLILLSGLICVKYLISINFLCVWKWSNGGINLPFFSGSPFLCHLFFPVVDLSSSCLSDF